MNRKYHSEPSAWSGASWMLLIVICVQLALPPLALAKTGHCTSTQLPASMNLQANITSNTVAGDEIQGSRQSATLGITCNPHWDDERNYCTNSKGWAFIPDGGHPVSTSVPNTYRFSTFPPGVGYQALDLNGNPMPLVGENHDRHDTKVHPRDGYQQVPLAFRLIKLGDSIPQSSDFKFQFRVACENNEYANIDSPGSKIYINAHLTTVTQTCKLENPDIQVTLPTIGGGQFSSVGDTGGSTLFALKLNCMADAAAKVFFSDINDLPNGSSILAPSVNTTAGGISFQMRHAGDPVMLVPGGTASSSGTFINVSAADGSEHISIPLEAEYIQSGSSVTAGKLEAQAMVTIAYD